MRDGSSTSRPGLRPLVRFWWLPVLGLAIAVIAGVQVLDQLRPGWPPRLVERSPVQYAATAQVLVDTPAHPYLMSSAVQTTLPNVELQRTCPQDASGNRHCSFEPAPVPQTSKTIEPDSATPVADANIYPMLVESDQVRAFRDRLYRKLPAGTISATALGARDLTPGGSTTGGGNGAFTPSRFPIVEITATAESSADAGRLAAATTDAFVRFVRAQQRAQSIPPDQRVLLEVLRVPAGGAPASSNHVPAALVAAAATMLGCLVLPFLLDATLPRRRTAVPAA